jgi:hypothetical protein
MISTENERVVTAASSPILSPMAEAADEASTGAEARTEEGEQSSSSSSGLAPAADAVEAHLQVDCTTGQSGENDLNLSAVVLALDDNVQVPPAFVQDETSECEAQENDSRSTPTNANIQDRPARNPEKILSLPMDALHGIASFLTPTEWCMNFGTLNRACLTVCREIVHRAVIHGFKCATEIATSWKLGMHEDAKELAVLYVSSGVPVYPRSLGHSLHTLLWRMQVEVREVGTKQGEEESVRIDPFYQARGAFRSSEGVSPDMTYLELKSLFFMQKVDEGVARSRRSLSSVGRNASPVRDLIERRVHDTASTGSELPTHKRKLPLRIHQHLLDQHIQRRECADGFDGLLATPTVSLSADFYHPQNRRRQSLAHANAVDELARPLTNAVEGDDRVGSDGNHRTFSVHPPARRQHNRAPLVDELFEPHLQISPFKDHSVLEFLDLEVYSAASIPSYKHPDSEKGNAEERNLHSRFEIYQRRLESFLARGDNIAFEDYLLDFWDEVFPCTAGIQYYDRHTAVPRVSRLRDFLTKPCPKAIGIMQCEIERVKTTSRGKGVNMKGRLFPTYEYRLFIRDRPHDNAAAESALLEDNDFIRNDCVLMVAKNKGRKHTESSGIIAMSSPKKGSNNYFLQMPQQMDVDAHFNKVNKEENSGRMKTNGASHEPVVASSDPCGVVLGRLQSNFIGTEFQIFVPRLQKNSMQRPPYSSPSDDEVDYDSGVSSDNITSRRSRFSRLSLRRTPADVVLGEVPSRGRNQFLRAASSPDISHTRQGRANRRAIANTPDAQEERTYLLEEEDGVVTYTANLLGSRPRIMDVCIPKVSPSGVAGAEWRSHVENCCELEDIDMLSAFRQLLQQMENQEQNAAPEDADSERGNAAHVEDFGLHALQNRPPWWNIELGSFVLNFGGRVSVASVKNFQLCDRDDQDKILLQFGRIQGRHSFTMDFQHPLSPVQAFSIAISSLQSKLSFG